MRYTWQTKDITSGRRVSSWNRAEQYILGYDPSEASKANRTVVSLADGMIAFKCGTREQLVAWLNAGKMRPDVIDTDDVQEEKHVHIRAVG